MQKRLRPFKGLWTVNWLHTAIFYERLNARADLRHTLECKIFTCGKKLALARSPMSKVTARQMC